MSEKSEVERQKEALLNSGFIANFHAEPTLSEQYKTRLSKYFDEKFLVARNVNEQTKKS